MNNSKGKTNSYNTQASNNFPKFLNKNYKSTTTEKLYTAIPKNLISSSKINKDLKMSPSLKIASQFEQGSLLFII